MHKFPHTGWTALVTCLFAGQFSIGQESPDPFLVDMNPFTVYADSLLSTKAPASQVSDRMAREIRVDLQSRGSNRYQTDISIRGGIFEGTGLTVGGLALFDPQTGHYFAEIPLDPAFFGAAYLLTGVENGIHGFNSTAGTINWEWAELSPGGNVWGRVGSDGLLGGGIRGAAQSGNGRYEISLLQESGDGSVENGDFEMFRLSGRSEHIMGNATVRFFAGYLDKFYGWPGMYTGFALNETDAYSVALLGWQAELNASGKNARHRIGGYWRELDDDYEFNRGMPNRLFEHKTEVYSIQGDGLFAFEETELVYRWALLADRIIRSTSLVNGDFTQREYAEGALLAKRRFSTDLAEWTFYGGFAVDTTSKDSTRGLPQAGLRATGYHEQMSWSAYLEYAESSQVPGYTVLNSPASGLFGGNKDLGRENASTVEAGYTLQVGGFNGKLVVFRRSDSNLVDWVYDTGSPTARQAQPVDIEVSGVEAWLGWATRTASLQLGYILLDKDETYLHSGGDASFYALNYARHRILLTMDYSITEYLGGRLELEWRQHPSNALRLNGDEALRLNADISWSSLLGSDWDVVFSGTNLTRDDFAHLPGTQGPGRELFLTLNRDW